MSFNLFCCCSLLKSVDDLPLQNCARDFYRKFLCPQPMWSLRYEMRCWKPWPPLLWTGWVLACPFAASELVSKPSLAFSTRISSSPKPSVSFSTRTVNLIQIPLIPIWILGSNWRSKSINHPMEILFPFGKLYPNPVLYVFLWGCGRPPSLMPGQRPPCRVL